MEQDSVTFSSNVPAFLIKLWKLVEDVDVNDLISWSKNGNSFCVHEPVAFAKDVLPMYFKHNNFTSFVRQLNMYGFKKVISSEHGGIKPDKDEWEFHHPNFLKSRLDLLGLVKRKVHPEEKKNKTDLISTVLEDVKDLHLKHDVVHSQLESVKEENEILWQEIGELRLKHRKQQHVLNKLIKFLILVYGGKGSGGVSTRKRLAIGPGQASPQRRNLRQLSEIEHLDNLQYSVTSPVRTEEIFPLGDEQSGNGPQIVVLPDEPTVQSTEVNSPSVDERESFLPSTSKGNKSAKASFRKRKHSASSKSKEDSLQLKMPTMVPISAQRDPVVDFSPSIFESVANMFPLDPISTTGDALQELQTSFPVNDERTAVVLSRSISRLDKEEIDFDVDQIDESLDSLQNMLSGPSFNIDPETLDQLFNPEDVELNTTNNPLSHVRAIRDLGTVPQIVLKKGFIESLQTASDEQETTDRAQSEDVDDTAPFSPGMFLNDVGETSNDAAINLADNSEDSLL